MYKKLTLLVLVISINGCGTTAWTKNQPFTQEQFYMDQADCNARAFSIPNAPIMQISIVQNQCLRSKGWYQTRQQ